MESFSLFAVASFGVFLLSKVFITNRIESISTEKIATSPRIGVDYAEEDANLPWRFYLSDSQWVS